MSPIDSKIKEWCKTYGVSYDDGNYTIKSSILGEALIELFTWFKDQNLSAEEAYSSIGKVSNVSVPLKYGFYKRIKDPKRRAKNDAHAKSMLASWCWNSAVTIVQCFDEIYFNGEANDIFIAEDLFKSMCKHRGIVPKIMKSSESEISDEQAHRVIANAPEVSRKKAVQDAKNSDILEDVLYTTEKRLVLPKDAQKNVNDLDPEMIAFFGLDDIDTEDL